MRPVKNKIDGLLNNHIPFLPLSEIFEIRNGYTPSKSETAYWDNGNVPWFRIEDIRRGGRVLDAAAQKCSISGVKSGKLFEEYSLIISTLATIGEHALVTVPFIANQQLTVLTPKADYKERLSPKFMLYFGYKLADWCRRNTVTASFASVDIVGFRKFQFPLPPIEVQHEIVRILDTFTELEAALEAEMEARKLQLTGLLDHFYPVSETHATETHATETLTLGECGEFIRGNGMLKSTLTKVGTPAIHYGEIHTHYLASTRTTRSFVSNEYAAKLRKANPGDVILATTAEDNLGVAKACAWLGNMPAAVSGDAYIYRSNLHPLFAAYFFQSRNFALQKATQITGTKVKRISGAALAKVRIPRIGQGEQAQIGELLQKIDSLAQGNSSGLQAEIAARRKQYEYYRDQLLNFNED